MKCEFQPERRFDPDCDAEATVVVKASLVTQLIARTRKVTDTWQFCEKHRKESIAELWSTYDEVEVAE